VNRASELWWTSNARSVPDSPSCLARRKNARGNTSSEASGGKFHPDEGDFDHVCSSRRNDRCGDALTLDLALQQATVLLEMEVR